MRDPLATLDAFPHRITYEDDLKHIEGEWHGGLDMGEIQRRRRRRR